jgi:Ca2+-binding EF-hand superfamily protein
MPRSSHDVKETEMNRSGHLILLLGILLMLLTAGCKKASAPPEAVAVAPPPTEVSQPPVAEMPAEGQPSQTVEPKPEKAAAATSAESKPASPAAAKPDSKEAITPGKTTPPVASKPATSKPAPAANRPTGGGQRAGGGGPGGPPGEGFSIEERFKSWDKNKDGKLTADELPSERMLEWLDTNKDGSITLEEAKKAMENRPRAGGGGRGERPQLSEAERKERLEARFKERDANNDGKLTAGEIPEELLERLDTNKDGAVSKEEMANARRQRGPGGAGGPGGGGPGRGPGGGN